MMSIKNQALLVNVTTHQWRPTRKDDNVTNSTNRLFKASHESGRYIKNLVRPEWYRPIEAAVKRVQIYVRTHTVPWDNYGFRCLNAKYLFQFREGYNEAVEDFQRIVDQQVAKIDSEFILSKQRLGDMYCASDYPTKEEIKSRYSINMTLRPIQEAENFLVEASDSDAKFIAQKVREDMAESTKLATDEPWERLYEIINDLSTRLDKPIEDKGRDGRISSVTMERVERLLNILPMLNVANDPKLEEMNHAAKQLLKHNPDALRNNAKTRNQARNQADDILNRMRGYAQEAA
jgi:hypothetical protein